MKKELQLLFIEDSPDDAELILLELEKGGLQPYWECVDNTNDLQKALNARKWDIILSDYSMQGFNGIEALLQVRATNPIIPFILISGAVGEEVAVKVMKNGGQDFVLKDRLVRLVPAIKRELEKAEIKKEAMQTAMNLKESEKRYRELFDFSFDGLFIVDQNGKILSTNESTQTLFDYPSQDSILQQDFHQILPDLITQVDLQEFFSKEKTSLSSFESKGINFHHQAISLELTLSKIQFKENTQIACAIKDITEKLILEQKEKELLLNQMELQNLNKELEYQTIYASNKNKLLNEIENEVKKVISIVEEKGKIELQKLVRKIEKNKETEDNFYTFQLKFEKNYPGFFDKLWEINPNLSNNDKKLCALIRLGMDTIEIADFFFMAKRSVEMSKYRLKKKLQLNGSVKLSHFINQL